MRWKTGFIGVTLLCPSLKISKQHLFLYSSGVKVYIVNNSNYKNVTAYAVTFPLAGPFKKENNTIIKGFSYLKRMFAHLYLFVSLKFVSGGFVKINT